MKTLFIYFLLVCSLTMTAQQHLDTIYVNDQKNVALFFPNPIRQGITGASHFVFTYNREKEQFFGLLQAKQGTESNLLAVTNDGRVYSYILKYSEELPKLNYFIGKGESIGNERPTVITEPREKKPTDTDRNRAAYFQKASEYFLKTKYESIVSKRENGIKVQLQKMVYLASEVYLVIEIRNRSGIDFEIDYLNVYRANGDKRRKASFQKLQQEGVYKHKMPFSIGHGISQRFVYVLPKFVLGSNEKLLLELKELNGSRKVVLETKLY